MSDYYDVVIAGAGISGLSLACLLAAGGGYSVLLAERGPEPGGRFKVEERDGYLLDWGVHACLLGARGATAKVLRVCNLPVDIIPVGIGVCYKGEVRDLLGEKLTSIARQRVLKPKGLVKLGFSALALRKECTYFQSLTEWLDEHGSSSGERTLLESLSVALLATSDYHRASAGEIFSFLRQAARRMSAAGYPAGGWKPILDSLVDFISGAHGFDLRVDAPLERIITSSGTVAAAVVGDEEIETRAVVCAFPPQVLAGDVDLKPPLPPEYAARIRSLESSYGVCIEMGLKERLTEEKRMILSSDPPCLVWATSNVSPRIAPRGKQLLQFFSPIEGKRKDDRDSVTRKVDELLGLGEEVLGGSFREEWRRVMITEIGAVVPVIDQSYPRRPRIRVPRYRGLFMIGDGVRVKGLGGDLATRSAITAQRRVLEYLSRAAVSGEQTS